MASPTNETIITRLKSRVIIRSPQKDSQVPVVLYAGRDIPGDDDDGRQEEEMDHKDSCSKQTDDPISRRKRRHKSILDEDLEENISEDELETNVPVNPALNYFIGVTVKSQSTTGKEMEMEDVDESNVNYLESDIAMNSLRAKNVSKFGQIFLLLKEKFCVILYGFGSKRKLLHSFADKFLQDEHYLMINGYFPGLSYRDITNQLKDALDAESADRDSLVEAAQELEQDFFLVIHSIDVLFSSTPTRVKNLIFDLVICSQGRIHLLASFDHLNSGILFDSTVKTKMDLVWIETKTFIPYTIERGYSLSADNAANTGLLTLNSVLHVYESLTPNAQKIFIQILEYCLEQKKKAMEEKQKVKEFKALQRQKQRQKKSRGKSRRKKNIIIDSDKEEEPEDDGDNDFGEDEEGNDRMNLASEEEDLPLSTLYRICREEYLVNSEITLKAQLTEFQDHNIIKVTKGSDGAPVIKLKLTLDLTQSFLSRVRA